MKYHHQLRCGVLALCLGGGLPGLANAVEEVQPSHITDTLILQHNVPGLRPEMLDWWWDNLTDEADYQNWHPQDHGDFYWINGPDNTQDLPYSAYAQYQITEYIAGHEVPSVVTYMPKEMAQDWVSGGDWILTEKRFTESSSDEPGWVLRQYQVNDDLDGVTVTYRYHLPDDIDEIYPGYREAFAEHLQQEMEYLADFLPDRFLTEYIQAVHRNRGTFTVTQTGWLEKTVVVDQEIIGITPAMMDWWWDNIADTARYMQWHPTAHISFEWESPPSDPTSDTYSVGAVQIVEEYLGPYYSELVITWLDPEGAKDLVEYDHYLYGQTELKLFRGLFQQTLLHEYTWNNTGDGILMRSTFTIPSFLDWVLWGFSKQLGYHALEEMQFLPHFLPELYESRP